MAIFDQDDPYAELERSRARLGQALRTGVTSDPDALARDRAEAARRGMSVVTYRAAREAGLPLAPPQWEALPQNNPNLAAFLSRPENAAVAHDDIETMGTVERLFARAGERTVRLGKGLGRALFTIVDAPADLLARGTEALGLPSMVEFGEDGVRLRRATEADYASPVGGSVTERLLDTRNMRTIAPGTSWDEVKQRPLMNFLPFALEEGLVSTADMALALANLPGYIASRTGEIGQTRAENDTRENATVADLVAALPPAAASALLERLGTRGIVGLDDTVRGGLRGVPAAAARAGIREGATEAAQSFVEYTGGTLGTETGFDIGEAVDQTLAGVVAGTPFGAAVRGATGTAEVAAERFGGRRDAAAEAEQTTRTLEQLARLSEASRLRERDPATFREFVDTLTDGTSVENVYVDAQTLAQSAVEANVNLDTVPGLAEQLPEALATGGDVRIATADFAAYVAGTELEAPLLPHLRTDPFAMTQAEAKDFVETQGEQLQAEVERAVAAGVADSTMRSSMDTVRERITADLNGVGRFTADVNKAYASVVASFYAVQGSRLGLTAEQMAERYPLRFIAELPGAREGGAVLEQDGTVELVHFGRAPGLSRSDPSLWGASRATSAAERARKGRAPDRTYFYDASIRSRPERAVGMLSPFEYRAQVPASRLYDFDADPLGLKPEGPMTTDAAVDFENAVKERGFLGYRFGSVVSGAVALFEPVELRQVGPLRTAEDAQALDARMREMAQADRRERLAQAGPEEMVPTRDPEEFRDAALDELFSVRVSDRFAPENIERLLEFSDWAVLTAENPQGQQATAEANARAQARLAEDLRALGVDFQPAVGRYGQIENSFVVVGITEDQARELGRKYDQDSVLTRKGLIYQDGRVTPATDVTAHSSRPDDFFTEVPSTGALFTVDLNFDAETAQTDTAAFKAWFGDSKVVDENGDPLVVYHGTGSEFDVFGGLDAAGWFAETEELADVYAKRSMDRESDDETWTPKERIVEAYLSIQNPKTVTEDMNSEVTWDEARAILGTPGVGWGPAQQSTTLWEVVTSPEIVAVLREQGFDGVRVPEGGVGTWLAFDPTQIKSVDNRGSFDPSDPVIYNQDAPTFYSALLRAVENSPTAKAPAAQWKATLAKTAGVKKEEIEWSGLNEELDLFANAEGEQLAFLISRGQIDAKGNISREAVAAFLRAGGVQVEERVLGGVPVGEFYVYRSGENGGWQVESDDSGVVGPEYETEAEARDALEEILQDQAEGLPAQYSNYKLPGADDSYRELLITLPNIEGPSTHWDEPNVVAHVRFTERHDAEGARVLFLEELQSDWHQKGRDEGYRQTATPEQRKAVEDALEQAGLNLVTAEQAMLPAAERIINARLDFYEAKLAELDASGIGEVSRQDLRDSVAMGAERVAIQEYRRVERQLDLYQDLLNAVDLTSGELRNRAAIRAAFDTPNWGPNVGLPMPTDAERAAAGHIAAGLRYQEAQIALDRLEGGGIPDAPFRTTWPALVMKRMIRWAVDHGYDKVAWINGNQQNGGQTGGDGSFFYERNLVNVANDLLKRYGTRVEPVDMRDDTARTRAEQAERRQANVQSELELETDPGARASLLSEAQYQSDEAAFNNRPATELGIQNGFTITDELRAAAREGFALFQQHRGQIAFGQDITQQPSVISILRTADLSTFLHETGHFFLEATAHMANQVDVPAGVREDMDAVLKWFGEDLTLDRWNRMTTEERRPYHEQFARGFEAYLFEGRAPSLQLRDLFRRFSAWLKNVYRSLTALDVTLTDEVRSVFDRMLAAADDIRDAEDARAFAPLFETKPEGMSEDQWAEYQRLGVQATAEAVEQLEQRSARDMRWASGAKDRYVKELQREAEEQRKTIRAEVTAEVMAEPVNRAREFLRRGIGENGEPVEGALKLDLATLKTLYGEDGLWTRLRRGGKYGEVATDGMHPDVAASLFGYASGEALIEDLVNGEVAADKIKGLTDQRMLERYGDLSDPQSIERAANDAVANDARAKFVAAEMTALDRAVGRRSILNEAAREHAAKVVNRLEMKRLRPAQYLAAQQRAARAADQALKKDDLVAAATAKRNQLINLHTARAVQKAQRDFEKTNRLFTRIISAKDDALSRTRNMDLVNAARAVLALYGVGRVKNDPTGYMEALKRYDPTLYADLAPFINGMRGDAKPITDITYEQFQGLRDTVGQLWQLSRRTRQVEIDGQLVDRRVVTDALGARLDEIGLPANRPGTERAPTPGENRVRDLLGLRAALRRVESWARGLDGEDAGPFRRFIWNPVSQAADRYRAESGAYIRRFRDLLDTVRADLKPGEIKAPEIGYTFGGKAELYHALLHTGNGSNKSKLLLGRSWGLKRTDGSLDDTRWQAFVDRLHAEGVLTERDWTFIQAVWDLLEETKPGAQRAHRAIYGRYFDEIAADPVETPFGRLRGGYVPALTDAFLVQDAVLRAEQEAIEGGDSAMFPAASNGFTKSRVEDYTRQLALDLQLLPMHIDKVLKFTHLGPPVRDVARILKDRQFSAKLEGFDPTAQTDLLLPWLQRAAKQIVETPSKGRAGKAADRFFSALRSRVGMQLMFANVVNTAQQVTGFSNVLLRVRAANLAEALWAYTRDPKGVSEAAASASVFLANRMNSDIFEARQTINQLTTLNPSAREKAVDFAQRHAYFMQSALQNVMDVISWTGAYNQATARGDVEADAIRFADSVIRETQGSMAPEDVSRFETGTPFMRMFTQFAGYFNMMANLNATEVQQVARGVGLRKGAGRLFYVYLMGFAVPAIIGDAIAKGLRGGWEDEDGDGYMDDLFAWFFVSQAKFGLAMVPGVGQVGNALIGTTTGQPYDDRVSLSPAISVIESGVKVPAEVYQSIVEGEEFNRNDTRNLLNLLGVLTGTPAGAVSKPAGYAVGVAQGEVEPTGALDATRGAITGTPSPESRTN